MNVNKVIMIGNLTRDPETKTLSNNTKATEFGLATNRRWTTRDGEKREETCFIDCQLYGKAGETFAQYKKKGDPVYIEGTLRYSTWETETGEKRSTYRVMVDQFEFLNRANTTTREPATTGAWSPNQADTPF